MPLLHISELQNRKTDSWIIYLLKWRLNCIVPQSHVDVLCAFSLTFFNIPFNAKIKLQSLQNILVFCSLHFKYAFYQMDMDLHLYLTPREQGFNSFVSQKNLQMEDSRYFISVIDKLWKPLNLNIKWDFDGGRKLS